MFKDHTIKFQGKTPQTTATINVNFDISSEVDVLKCLIQEYCFSEVCKDLSSSDINIAIEWCRQDNFIKHLLGIVYVCSKDNTTLKNIIVYKKTIFGYINFNINTFNLFKLCNTVHLK